mmetsp:Transcript_32569/g.54622  ORF Transcript_32569/g.54622 Transcript_32569/m.54622 type:complete len:113 (-) Transcript_32569:556-894(-)|eukprot:CAMPEP_0198212100 /NCGR_PEP_ID=MMETSP1445-20131203/25521_1 /TAXON_ID=36898 /ORGANISM="Pyramimonas sp., Strain CCMP2087" /LENGTH=112 /DNA_ID=CAMNT_0043886481 /DNA_START=265 /DNA_END=603 /DNA_ORIENTATION=-
MDAAPPDPLLTEEVVELKMELKLLEALEIYRPNKLVGVHRSFVLIGLVESLERRLDRPFTTTEVLEVVDRFYNLEKVSASESDDDAFEEDEEFSLPPELLPELAKKKETTTQ